MKQPKSAPLHSRPLWFDQAQKEVIDRSLLKLADQTGAPLVMLADVSGRLILYRGRLPEAKTTGLAALAAGSFSAGVEMGNFLGLPQSFEQQLHEGKTANLYTLAVGVELLLVVVFTRKIMLGMVRFFAEHAKEDLLLLAEEAARVREEMPDEPLLNDAQLADAVAAQLDSLFLTEKGSNE